MICENTISAGFYFMAGKFLFDAAVFGAVVIVAAGFFGLLYWSSRK